MEIWTYAWAAAARNRNRNRNLGAQAIRTTGADSISLNEGTKRPTRCALYLRFLRRKLFFLRRKPNHRPQRNSTLTTETNGASLLQGKSTTIARGGPSPESPPTSRVCVLQSRCHLSVSVRKESFGRGFVRDNFHCMGGERVVCGVLRVTVNGVCVSL